MKTKKCSKCGEIKPLTEFNKDSSRSHGYTYNCKSCIRKHRAKKRGNFNKYIIKLKREKLFKEGKSICNKCGKIKSLSKFPKDTSRLFNHQTICKSCKSKQQMKYMINKMNPIKLKRYKKNKERIKLNKKLFKLNKLLCAHCGKIKNLNEFHKDSSSPYGHYYICKDCNNKKNRKRLAKLRQKPRFKLNHSIGSEICRSLKGNKNGRHWEDLVGYALNELKKHLEKQFDNKMTWDNYGSYWHIDHIIPKSKFNYTKPEHIGFKRAWALENLQPLEAKENMRKHDKLIKDKQEHLMI